MDVFLNTAAPDGTINWRCYDTQVGYSDVGNLVCHKVTYPRGDGILPSRFNAVYSATLTYRIFNKNGNARLSEAPYGAILRVHANNGNQTHNSGWITARGEEREYSEDAEHTFHNLTLNRGDSFTVELMHISRQTHDYWPDLSLQFSSVVVSVEEHARSALNG